MASDYAAYRTLASAVIHQAIEDADVYGWRLKTTPPDPHSDPHLHRQRQRDYWARRRQIIRAALDAHTFLLRREGFWWQLAEVDHRFMTPEWTLRLRRHRMALLRLAVHADTWMERYGAMPRRRRRDADDESAMVA